MRGEQMQMRMAIRGEVCLGASKAVRLPFWDCQSPSSIAIYRRYARFAVAQAGQKGNPGLKTAGNLANVG
jgi:hypothetical protein